MCFFTVIENFKLIFFYQILLFSKSTAVYCMLFIIDVTDLLVNG